MNGDQGIFVPALLGIVEGLTEFLPVSSTAHLLLLGHFLGFDSPGHLFEVLIQLGAILAIVVVYFWRLIAIARDALARKPGALRFILGVVLAAAPAAIAGVVFHDFIKNDVYGSPLVICVAFQHLVAEAEKRWRGQAVILEDDGPLDERKGPVNAR